MKVLVKNLHNQQFTVECDEDNSIKELKEKIADQKEIEEKYDAELIKLLYAGKVMDDEDAVSNYSIKPDGYLVLVKQLPGKPKPPPKKKPYQGFNTNMGFGAAGMGGLGGFGSGSLMQNPFQQDSFGALPFQQNSFPQASGNPNAFSSTSFGQGASLSSQANKSEPQSHTPFGGAAGGFGNVNPEDFSTPQDREEALQSLLAMGFDKEQSGKALRASFYNVEAAIEHLTSGNIPNVSATPSVPQPTGSTRSSGGAVDHPTNRPVKSTATHESTGSGDMGANLQQMRQMLQQNPEQLQLIKETIKADHPEIAEMIDKDPKGFLDLLNQASGDVDNQGPPAPPRGSGNASGTNASGSSSAGRTLSAKDQEIIDRFQAMGFDRSRAIEAYFTCNRDENMAANYLLNTLD